MNLKVNEIFLSLEGETTTAGLPALFIRLTGCNLRCSYCDSESSYFKGEEMSIDNIMKKIKTYTNFHHITLTGGEPLLQKASTSLIDAIIDMGYNLQIETNGTIPINLINKQARIILDVKTPSSGEDNSFLISNIKHLSSNDEIKFVLSSMKDYIFAKNFIKEHLTNTKLIINFSPTFGKIPPEKLAQLIITDNINVRLNLQLHKLLHFS